MIETEDTIIAMATPFGVGAIAVLRISGKDAIEIAASCFQSINGKDLTQQPSQTIHLGYILTEKNQVLDEVLVSIFRSPLSYTGQNVVEISCHGSMYIQQKIVQLFIEKGCRMAEAGEFTLRAFLNGKMDLSQAEAVADLIVSNSEASHQVALSQMRGGISNELKTLRQKLLDFTALMELELDFSGEDVAFANREEFAELISIIIQVLKKLIDSFSFGNALKEGIPIAIIGSPNVGKSTLLNALIGEEKAIVSNIAGTTRDAVEDKIIIGGVLFRLIDTAGIRDTTDKIENIGIQKTYENATKAQLILYLIDGQTLENLNNTLQKHIAQIKNQFPNKPLITIVNKADLLSKELIKSFENTKNTLCISAKNETDIETVKQTLTSLTGRGTLSNNQTIVTNSRHFEALNKALQSILNVQIAMEQGIPSDLFCIDVRSALRDLGNITGEFDMDKDILERIFSNFCIGK